ncbi:hypothetical protein [Mycobacteroides salmoniphilum]|uniref:Peptidase family M28 n=1 Tax=Mycobacteroides salmoniphilum TaxID=404941 RepID=A0A4R8SCU2_9MYCO|nr:hypothetical protein [Mycobacteroides salmoniphilum]TDZ93102.1 hypothetical protein CCUG60885_03606 [Mycobacteroides salmoniphilum]TEA07693.1 hypothetical protein CCUG60883_00756 [Mycobacteroides salmoniphilum]
MRDNAGSASIITADQIEQEVSLLNRLKSRVTGSVEHEKLVMHIEEQLTGAGLDVRSDALSFTRWAPESDAYPTLQVAGQPVPIASVVPYSGTTGPGGVSGQLVRLHGPIPAWGKARGKIAVLEVNNFGFPFAALIDTWGNDAQWPVMRNPLIAATLAGLGLTRARKAGVKAVIFLWRNISDDHAGGQYIPFTMDYQGIPAVFVSGGAATTVLAGATRADQATLTLDYQLIPDSPTRTIWTMVEGTTTPDETVFVVTHTDGVNAVEENGHIAMVAMARAAVLDPPERTTIFVFTSGHMRIPAVTPEGQATQRFLADHPELWAGGAGRRRAVAGLAIEHLGAREFIDNPDANELRPTGRVEPELLYATTSELAQLARAEWQPEDGATLRVSRPTALIHFGEGEPLLHAGIPAISLVTAPLYLLAEFPGNETELVDNAALQRQVNNFERLYRRISSVGTVNFGHAEKPSKTARFRGFASLLTSIAVTKLAGIRHKFMPAPQFETDTKS